MWKYLQLHERFIRAVLAGTHGEVPIDQVLRFHQGQIRYMQHERLIHLIVTLFIALFFLISLGFVMMHVTWTGLALVTLLLILLSAYLVHYFRLENGVQRWYHLQNELQRRCGMLTATYEGNEYQAHLTASGQPVSNAPMEKGHIHPAEQ